MTLKNRLAELRELCDRATEGPWKWDSGNLQVETVPGRYSVCDVESNITGDLNGAHPEFHYYDTGEFIAESRTAMPQLIEALTHTLAWINHIPTINAMAQDKEEVEKRIKQIEQILKGGESES